MSRPAIGARARVGSGRYVALTDDAAGDAPYGATVQKRDHDGPDPAGAGVSPPDPGAAPDGDGDGEDPRSELVEAVEDLVRDLLPESGGCTRG